MSIRLNKRIREDIVHKAIKHGYDPKWQALKGEEHALAMEVYYDLMGGKKLVEELLPKIPKDWMDRSRTIRGRSSYNYKDKENLEFGDGKSMPMSLVARHPSAQVLKERLSEKTQKKRDDFFKKVDNLQKEQEEVEGNLKSLVRSVSTIERLAEVWPEGKKFLTGYGGTGNLPAIPVRQINMKLGLSNEEA